jgi:CheY-like chemotaxis protein
MKRQTHTILLIEDDPNDQALVVNGFRGIGVNDPIHVLSDGIEAIAYLNGEGKYADRTRYEFPTTILTDLKMPKMSGFDVLQHLKSDPEWAVIPTVVLSGSADPHDIKKAYQSGAASYFTKPADYQHLKSMLKRLYEYWKEAEIPEVNTHGKMLPTEPYGKLGEKPSSRV